MSSAGKHKIFPPWWLLVGLAYCVLPLGVFFDISKHIDTRWLTGASVLISSWTLFLYGLDKRRAVAQGRRVSERTLHISECLGGWLGAYAAQRIWRHKTNKTSYRWKFWSIGLLHQVLAAGYLWGANLRAIWEG